MVIPDNEEGKEFHRRRAVDLWLSFQRSSQSFTGQLFHLFDKADSNNKMRLGLGFPVELGLYLEWCASTPEWAFFEKYKIGELLDYTEKIAYELWLQRQKETT